MTINFHIPGQPVGKGRPRIGKVGAHARMFTPSKTVSYESTVALFAAQAMAGRPLLTGPVNLQMRVDFAIPASWSMKKQRAAEAGLILPKVKPDADNVIKAVCDAINGVVWVDDVQVVDLTLKKRYSVQPGVAVRIDELEPAA
jgi:Holliday junction resolvase RusA-like endonuclease